MNGLEIFLGYSCNLKCSFCFQKDLRYKDPKFIDYERVKKIIYDGSLENKTNLIFSGGDPMLDKNLLSYVIYAKNLGYSDIRIHTNGLLLSDKELFEKYIKAGVNAFIISIHGFGQVHDILVGADGAFKKVTKALLNFIELKKKYSYLVLDTNTVLTKHNYNTLDKLFKFLNLFPITRSQLVQIYSLGLYSEKEKKSLYIKYDTFRDKLNFIIENYGKNITLENFPFCEVNKEVYGNIIHRQKYDNDAYGNLGENLEESSTTFVSKCKDCTFHEKCTGYPKDYIKLFHN